MRNFNTAPRVPSGLILDTQIAIIEPEATTNLIPNPSFERGTANWTFSGALSPGTAVDRQVFGSRSLQIVASAGTATATTAANVITSGTQYTLSAYVGLNVTTDGHGEAVNEANFRFQQGGTVLDGAGYQYMGRGWYRVVLTFTATATTTIALHITGTTSDNFYVDGVQLEAKPYATTYCDGDQQGMGGDDLLPYRWTGQAHESTSIRSATTRSGGRPIWFDDLGVALLAITGLGMPGVQNTTIPFGIVDGGSYQRSRRPERSFSLAVQFQGETETALRRQRGALYRLLAHDLTGDDQMLRMYFQQPGGTAPLMQTDVLYGGGLEQSHTNEHLENANVQMIAPRLGLQSVGGKGTSQSGLTTLPNAGGRIWERSTDGVWSQIAASSVFNATIRQLAYSHPRQNILYAVGDFTTPGTMIAAWDGSAWSDPWSAFTRTSGSIRQVAFDGSGRVYVGGDYVLVSGQTVIGRFDPDTGTLTQLGTPPFSGVSPLIADVEFGPDGLLYICGNALFAAPNNSGVMRVDLATNTITPVGTGANVAPGRTSIVVFAPDEIYGASISIINDILTWNGTTWSVVVSNIGSNRLQQTADTSMITANQTASPETINRFNTLTVSQIGEVDASASNTLVGPYDAIRSIVYAHGDFTTINGVVAPTPVVQYPGGGWLPLDIDVPITIIDQVAVAADGRIAIAASADSTALASHTAGGSFDLDNPGDLPTPVTITLRNTSSSATSRIYQIRDVATGSGVWFSDLTLLPNEILTLTTDAVSISFASDTRPGTLLGTIAPGSQITALTLKPGSNRWSVFAANGVTFDIAYQPRYSSLDAGAQ